MTSAAAILAILDQCAATFSFPMLDNGYVYLAATRLSLHRSEEDWALVIEVFGYSPRGAVPDIGINTFASRLQARAAETIYDAPTFRQHLAAHPHDDLSFVYPFDAEAFAAITLHDRLREDATAVTLRGERIPLPPVSAYAGHGVELSEAPLVSAHELCRYLADVSRERVLATPTERRMCVPPELDEILVLDEWHHPDLVVGELPSSTETFRQLAQVLETGDVTAYQPTVAPNTHWVHWPEGGSL